MKLHLFAISASALFFNLTSIASLPKPPQTKVDFCSRQQDLGYFKSLLYNPDNQIAFSNRGGIGNGGVCWWHSLFLRAATHLVVYRPDLPKPTASEASVLMGYISQNRGVVEIPGFKNLSEFSAYFSEELQTLLEGWQIGDGGFGFGWIRGISGHSQVSPEKLKKIMDEAFELVTIKKQAIYQKLQIEGIEAHAWLVVGMSKNGTGYTLEVVDSNYSGSVRKVEYFYGMTQLSEYRSVPYTSRNSTDYSSFKYAAKMYCKYNQTAADLAATTKFKNIKSMRASN